MGLDALGLGDLAISDFTAWFGWLATILLTVNFALGVLQPLRYDTTLRWPHHRLPASLFRLHKWVGYSAVGVVVAHPIFLLWHARTPFSLSAIYIPFTAPAETLLSALGTIAFYTLVFVAATSFLRARFGLTLWKQFHYVSYALLPALLVHGLFVNSSLNEAVAIDYFDAGKLIVEVCIVSTIALVAWRLSYRKTWRKMNVTGSEAKAGGSDIVVSGNQREWVGRLRLAGVRRETPDIQTFRFVAEAGDDIPFGFQAGQYAEIDGIRNYTISSPPSEKGHIEFTVKREDDGFFSQYMHDELKIGDSVSIKSPFGKFTFDGKSDDIVLIAGGVGVTPFLSLTRNLIAAGWKGNILLLYAAHTESDIVRAEELWSLAAQHPNFNVHFFFSAARAGPGQPTGRITANALRDLAPDIEKRRVHICGPVPMMKAVAGMLAECGVPPASIFVESFGPALPIPKPKALAIAA